MIDLLLCFNRIVIIGIAIVLILAAIELGLELYRRKFGTSV